MKALPLYDEASLLKQIAAGDEAAFTTFYNLHWDKLCNYLFKITKSRETTEEIASDVFLKLWLGKEWVQDIRNVDAFLFKVAYNKAISFLRVTAGKPALQNIIEDQLLSRESAAADDALLGEEQRRILHEAIKQLSPQRRMVLMLSREKELSNDEIASLLNLSSNTVKNTLSDALKSVRGFLKSKKAESLIWFWLMGYV